MLYPFFFSFISKPTENPTPKSKLNPSIVDSFSVLSYSSLFKVQSDSGLRWKFEIRA